MYVVLQFPKTSSIRIYFDRVVKMHITLVMSLRAYAKRLVEINIIVHCICVYEIFVYAPMHMLSLFMNKFLKSKTVKAALGLVAVFAFAMTAHAYTFSTSLTMGSKGEAVRQLQIALNACSDTMVATTGAGSPGYETSVFAGKTKAAVAKFQVKAGVQTTPSSSGRFGPMTRTAMNTNGCGTNSTTPPVVSGAVTAMVATDSPSGMTLAGGSAFNPLLKLRLSNGTSSAVTVTGIKLTKTGFMSNTNVTGVSLYDSAAMQHGNTVTTLGANGVAILTFPTNPVTVPANGTADVWVKANLSSSATSGTIGFSVASAADITASGTIGGTFPLTGAQMTVVSGTSSLAAITADVGAISGSSGTTLNVDPDHAQEITKFRISETSSNEQIKLYGLSLWNNGTAAGTDYKDVELVDMSGNVVATAQPNGNVVKFNLSTPYLIDKGQSKDFTVRAKIIGGSNRTIQLVIYNDYDIDVRGVNTGVSILATPSGTVDTGTSFPVGDQSSTYNKVTVGTGSLVFSRATDSPSSAVAPGSTDVTIAKYNAKPIGEDMEIRGISFGITNTTNIMTGTVYVKVNGSIVYSAAANSTNFATAGTAASRTLSTYPILTAGQNNTIEVTTSILSSATTGSVMSNDFDITSVKRLITNDITDPTVAVVDGLSRSVQGGALVTSNLSTPVAATVVAGTSGFELADIELNAGSSGEDVRVASITIADAKNGTATYADITNLVLKDSSGNQVTTSSSTATNAATVGFTFTNPIIVAKNTSTVLKLYGDVVGGTASATHAFAATAVSATGKDTGATVTSSPSGTGQTMTIASGGQLSISTVSGTGATPTVAQLVNINTNDGVYLAYKWTAQTEAQKITTLKLKATGTALTQNNIKNVRLYAKRGSYTSFQSDATLFAQANQFSTCNGTTLCSFTWTSGDNLLPFTIDPNVGVTVWVKADIQGENVAKLGNDFYMSVTNDGTDVVAKGSVSGTTTTNMNGTANASGSANTISPFQVLVTGDSPTSGSTTQSSLGSGTQIARFKVTNNGSAQVTLTDATFTNSGSHTGSASRYTVYASSENSNDYTANSLAVSGSDTVAFGTLTTSVTLNGGSYRYLTVTLSTAGSVATGDTFSLSVASLGDIKYSVAESNLGYDGNQDGDLADTISSLKADGKPALGTLYK